MRLPRILPAAIFACVVFFLAVSAQASDAIKWYNPLQPCDGNCAFTVFAGQAVGTNVQDIFFHAIPPWKWSYDAGGIVGATASRRIATIFEMLDIEAEVGAAKRFGNMDEGEFWGAVYVRYIDFPWNKFLYTTLAVSTGLNYATGISDFEREMSGLNPPGGTHVLHYFSPELTFALPDHKDRQLVVRLHHRSGAYGVISGAFSGATYLTVGLRAWF
jgi:hypothetical protein